jgi:hypothetical protein
VRMDGSEPYRLDPSGDEPLRLAKRVRREALRAGGGEALREAVQRHFGMPPTVLGYSAALPEPLYVPIRSASS